MAPEVTASSRLRRSRMFVRGRRRTTRTASGRAGYPWCGSDRLAVKTVHVNALVHEVARAAGEVEAPGAEGRLTQQRPYLIAMRHQALVPGRRRLRVVRPQVDAAPQLEYLALDR